MNGDYCHAAPARPDTARPAGRERLLNGAPRVIVRHGVILEDNLRRDRITRLEVESEMRLAGIARLSDVAWAIIEPQGKISFIAVDRGGPAKAPDDGTVT